MKHELGFLSEHIKSARVEERELKPEKLSVNTECLRRYVILLKNIVAKIFETVY